MDIFNAVKIGDAERVAYLVEEQRVALQQRDAWDATPLYYAAFTGNQDLVKYLLTHGASCEEKTFDGERCLYAALNDQTRELLLMGGFKRAGARRHDHYMDFLEKLFVSNDGFEDIHFDFTRAQVKAHRFILSARCPALGDFIATRWKTSATISDFHGMEPAALQAVIEWCYTTRLEVPSACLKECSALLSKFQLQLLADQLSQTGQDLAGSRHEKLVVEPDRDFAKAQLQEDMSRTAEASFSGREADIPLFHDVIIHVKKRQFRAHKAILCARSDYFRVLLTSTHFKEGLLSDELRQGGCGLQDHVQDLSLALAPANIVALALLWMYTDRLELNLPVEDLLETLRLSEALICDGLKQKCALHLQPHVTVNTAIPFLLEAHRLEAQRLENACLWVIAQNLQQLIDEPEFSRLVYSSASSVQDRQEFDSVPIIDEIRFFIGQIHGEDTGSGNEAFWDEEGNIICSGQEEDFAMLSPGMKKLYLLQELMGRLGFEA